MRTNHLLQMDQSTQAHRSACECDLRLSLCSRVTKVMLRSRVVKSQNIRALPDSQSCSEKTILLSIVSHNLSMLALMLLGYQNVHLVVNFVLYIKNRKLVGFSSSGIYVKILMYAFLTLVVCLWILLYTYKSCTFLRHAVAATF